jgi:hypothetical protein
VDKSTTAVDRFLAKIRYDPATGCVLWTAGLDGDGYGSFKVTGRQARRAHIFAYETWVGPVPPGRQLDHRCHNEAAARGECAGGPNCAHRRCVNPAHLEAVTPRENSHRSPFTVQSIHAAKTHCPYGHPYDEANTYVSPAGGRSCRTCNRAKMERWQAEHHGMARAAASTPKP